jgi:exosortase
MVGFATLKEHGTETILARPSAAWPTLLLVGFFWLLVFVQQGKEWEINPQYSYGWGVPFLGLYLLARRWPACPARPWNQRWLPALLVALALLYLPIRLVYESNPDWRLVNWMAGLTATGISLMTLGAAGGWPWVRHFALPVLFLLTAVPWPGILESQLVNGLLTLVTAVTSEALNWMGVAAFQQGNIIKLANGLDVGVSEACSGVRSFQSTLMVALFVGELVRLSAWRRVALVGAGLVWAMTLNVGRATWLAWLTARKGVEVEGGWHDPAGYAVFALAVLGVWVLGRWMSTPMPRHAAPPEVSLPRWLPRGLAFGLVGWLLAVEVINECWYRYHERGRGPELTWAMNWPFAQEGFHLRTVPEDIQVELRSSQSEAAFWQRPDGSQWTIFFNKWKASQVSSLMSRVHRPEICLPGSGFKQVEERDALFTVQGLEMPFRLYVFENRGQFWHVFFCAMEERAAPRPPGSPNAQAAGLDPTRSQRLLAVLHGRRNLGQQVLEIATTGYPDLNEAQRRFEAELPRLVRATPAKP